jgi:PEP-CTERM motif-containing protein
MSNDLHDSMTRRIRRHFRALSSSPLRLALLGMFLLAGVTNARATTLNFSLTDGTNTMTWTLPSSPIPNSPFPKGFTMNGVTVLENGITPVTANIAFWNLTVNDGGISACATSATCDPTSDLSLFDTFDYLTFSGTTALPTFTPGTYTEPAVEDEVTENDGDTWALSTSKDANLTLTITPVTTPEPSSMLLLGSGLLGLMGMGLRRKRLA